MSILVIGGDGQVGRATLAYLNEQNYPAIGTTRRKISSQIYFDLKDSNYSFFENINISAVIVCASIASFTECERNSKESRETNVVHIVRLLEYLAGKSVYIIYISSSAVFNGEKKNFSEYDLLCPNTAYGLQKAEVEEFILQSTRLRSNTAIVRPTKIITLENKLFYESVSALKNSQSISMFSDYLLSPISMRYIQMSIFKLLVLKIPGIFHLSSDADISYFDLFKKISEAINVVPTQVLPSSKLTLENHTLFDQKFPSISMKSTSIKLGILPQEIDSVILDFLHE